ncbi:spore coat protein [Tissierella praeacuta]|uniref:spore coat protein n=1 Tax=Tissierella praeacuta TaxID=43131 RepID=UPI00333E948C
MMQERDIVNDILAGTKASINSYTTAIMECSNQQLRTTLQTLRNEAEQMQYQLYQMAEQKGYYTAAPAANQNDINQIKTTLTSAVNSTTTASNNQNQQMQ